MKPACRHDRKNHQQRSQTMWSFVRVPLVSNEPNLGVVALKKYFVSEGDIIRAGQTIAFAITLETNTRFRIVSNYDGRVLKTILSEGFLVSFGDPIATMELLSDPEVGLAIARCEVE